MYWQYCFCPDSTAALFPLTQRCLHAGSSTAGVVGSSFTVWLEALPVSEDVLPVLPDVLLDPLLFVPAASSLLVFVLLFVVVVPVFVLLDVDEVIVLPEGFVVAPVFEDVSVVVSELPIVLFLFASAAFRSAAVMYVFFVPITVPFWML